MNGEDGRDYMASGTGADIFVSKTTAESGAGTASSVVELIGFFELATGTSGVLDRIDLSAIDAIASVKGNQAFAFIGTAEFTAEGQIRVVQSGTATYLQVNAVGATGSDMTICLLGVIATQVGVEDFILRQGLSVWG